MSKRRGDITSLTHAQHRLYLFLVALLPDVREKGSHHITHVLYDHLVGTNVFHGEEAPVVNRRLACGKNNNGTGSSKANKFFL
jgi:hypothetical protein